MNIDINQILTTAGEAVILYAPKVVGALIVLVVGWLVIGWIVKRIRAFFKRSDFDPALETFLQSFIGTLLKVILIVIVISMLGVQTSSLIAVLGAASLAVGLALQGSLSNFAGGVLILIFKPFKVGDFIEAQSVSGKVKEIQIFNTILASIDNKKIVIPNGNLSNDVVINFTAADARRIDLMIGIGYGDEIKKAKDIVRKILEEMDLVISGDDSKKHIIGVGNLNDSTVDLDVRFWVKTDDYLTAKHEFVERLKLEFDAQGVSIPYPQTDVHIIEKK